MQIGFQTPGQWAELNERLTELVPGLPTNSEVRAYPTVGSAVVEIALGLAKVYPLKKKIAYIKNQDPTFDQPLMLLAREGYQLIGIAHTELTNTAAWLPQLDRETLFLMYAGTDPLLGIAWSVAQLEQSAKDSTFQKIRIDHCGVHLQDVPAALDRNMTRIVALPSGHALALAGERARLMGIVMPSLAWAREAWLKEVAAELKTTRADFKNEILEFEKTSPHKSKALFHSSFFENERIYDRAAIYWTDLDAAVLVDRLTEKYGQGFETASLSKWGGVRTMDWLKQFGLTAEMIRGLLFIDAQKISADLCKKINAVVTSVYADQQGL